MLGEHTVLHGSDAYAVPLRRFSAEIAIQDPSRTAQLPTNSGIHASFDFGKWAAFAKTIEGLGEILDLKAWEKEAERLVVYSDIPIGYGLGSSGAITAGIFKRYQTGPASSQLRSQLAALEGFFHGKSSGVDPYVSYENRAVYVEAGNEKAFHLLDIENPFAPLHASGGWFLLDSGQPRAGKDAIARFGESCNDKAWRADVLDPLIDLVDVLAKGLSSQNFDGLSSKLEQLSQLQLAELSFLIPAHIAKIWKGWLQEKTAYLKLCGAGGGGFFLGYAPDKSGLHEEVIWL